MPYLTLKHDLEIFELDSGGVRDQSNLIKLSRALPLPYLVMILLPTDDENRISSGELKIFGGLLFYGTAESLKFPTLQIFILLTARKVPNPVILPQKSKQNIEKLLKLQLSSRYIYFQFIP